MGTKCLAIMKTKLKGDEAGGEMAFSAERLWLELMERLLVLSQVPVILPLVDSARASRLEARAAKSGDGPVVAPSRSTINPEQASQQSAPSPCATNLASLFCFVTNPLLLSRSGSWLRSSIGRFPVYFQFICRAIVVLVAKRRVPRRPSIQQQLLA